MSEPDQRLVDRAVLSQRSASDPTTSVWVSASAGTGKTKVLTDRVLSLLVAGNDPQKIICLTFTRAAAAEMESRIAKRLGKWSTIRDQDLRIELHQLTGTHPSKHRMLRARQLFALVLETPGGIKIETIHAFCQSLLRRFPLEASIAPHFKLMDERDTNELLVQAREDVLARANTGREKILSAALAVITSHTHEASIPTLLASLTAARGRLHRLLIKHGDIAKILQHVRKLMSVDEEETSETILSSALTSHTNDKPRLRYAAEILSAGSKTDIERAKKIQSWLDCDKNPIEKFELYADAFLTAARYTGPIEIRKSLVTKKIKEANPDVKDILEEEANRLAKILTRVRSAIIVETTEALLHFSDAFLTSYQKRKEQHSLIDYDDLIQETGRLLNREGIAPWVLFKLDGGIDHVLIDEAQDTSPEQWGIIKALVDEFTVGNSAQENERTVFSVGDLKQSIYSFQGADPGKFQAMQSFFRERVSNAGHNWREVNLTVSFRSTPAILMTVDAVFTAIGAQDGVMLDGNVITHEAARAGDGGLVELWPPVEPREADTPIAWKPPIERIQRDSPPTRLARLIAERIHRMIKNEENLLSHGRAIQAGDIMVLVRQRGTIVEELVRALKSRNIGVAGSDRMVLTEQISVLDLMALGRFLLLPQDDLTLAIVLKSPFIGFDETNLFDLAYNRSGSLWQELNTRFGDDNMFQKAYEFLSNMLSKVDFVTPFELYSYLLDAKEGRKNILSRLGSEAADPISEFLNLALAYEQNHTPSLEGFLDWMEAGNVVIKRDLEHARPEAVRIMTVHGAKGLQAPIVFLPDTMQMPTHLPPLLWPQDQRGGDISFIWPPRRSLFDNIAEEERKKAINKRDQEYRRLLYVAMTRAQDRLYICGWHTKKAVSEECWYNKMEMAISRIGEKIEDPLLTELKETSDNQIIQITSPQRSIVRVVKTAKENIAHKLDQWALSPAPDEPITHLPLTPSYSNKLESAACSPLSDDKSQRFNRGNIIHRLLQTLPDVADGSRREAARRYLALDTHKLSNNAQAKILEETLAVINDPNFHTIFGLSSRAEVPLVGEVNGKVISAQIDRLVVQKDRIMIVDYKTTQFPPTDPMDVPETYLRQMSAYKVALERIYPGRNIECLLLWTNGPNLMHLKTELLATYSP